MRMFRHRQHSVGLADGMRAPRRRSAIKFAPPSAHTVPPVILLAKAVGGADEPTVHGVDKLPERRFFEPLRRATVQTLQASLTCRKIGSCYAIERDKLSLRP